MLRLILKTIVSALILVGASELAKRYTTLGAIILALPLTSILAMVWLYVDTRSNEKIIDFSFSIFWMVLPTLAFFLILPALLNAGLKFAFALPIACALMALIYVGYVFVLKQMGVEF